MAGTIRERHGDDQDENSEINVVPFIDIMLVLLIVFMVAAPLATVDVNVDLPVSNAPPVERPDTPAFLTLQADLTLLLGEEPFERHQLEATLDAFTQGDKDTRIFLRADRAVEYGELMEVMNLLRAASYLSVALVGLEGAAATPGSGSFGGSGGDAGEAPASPGNPSAP